MADTLIIGAGHNGLVAAALLARAGHRVTVLERRPLVGGACVTEELAPGFRVSTCSYLVSLLPDSLVRDLDLARHGYSTLSRDPASFTPLPDGRHLMLGADADFNHAQIAKFSTRDADAYPAYEAFLTRVAQALEPVLESPPPEILPLPASWRRWPPLRRLAHLAGAWRLRRSLASLGDDLPAAVRLLFDPAQSVLDRWFESEPLKATLATDGVIGAFLPPSAPGTGYVLLHHVMGAAGGARGVWAYVRGGMGTISQALRAAAEEAGAEIRTGVTVREILHAGGRAHGLRLDDGSTLAADTVLSNATPAVTFEQLMDPGRLPPRFAEAVGAIDYASASVKINLALSGLPDFLAAPGGAGPQHRGTIHIAPDCAYIEAAHADARAQRPARQPLIEMTLPSVLDDSLAPAGQHVAQLFVQYAPYALRDNDWDAERDVFADRCLHEIDRYAPGFSKLVLHRQVLTPPDLEREFGLTGGNIFHGAMSPAQLLSLRPVPGWSDHRTPIAGLYLCGAGCHPGGGVSGLPGRNAARAVLADR